MAAVLEADDFGYLARQRLVMRAEEIEVLALIAAVVVVAWAGDVVRDSVAAIGVEVPRRTPGASASRAPG